MESKNALSLKPSRGARGSRMLRMVSMLRMSAAVFIAAALGFFAHRGVLHYRSYRSQPPIGAASQERYPVPLGDAPVKGPSDAKVTIVEYADLQCRACANAAEVLARVVKRHRKVVRVAFKHYPLPGHEHALPAAEATMAAAEQGRFWEMNERLLHDQEALDRPNFEKHAAELGLDLDRFKAALDSGKFKAAVEADAAEAQQFGVSETPTLFVNGRHLEGGWSDETFDKVIVEEVAAADHVRQLERPLHHLPRLRPCLVLIAAPGVPPFPAAGHAVGGCR